MYHSIRWPQEARVLVDGLCKVFSVHASHCSAWPNPTRSTGSTPPSLIFGSAARFETNPFAICTFSTMYVFCSDSLFGNVFFSIDQSCVYVYKYSISSTMSNQNSTKRLTTEATTSDLITSSRKYHWQRTMEITAGNLVRWVHMISCFLRREN